MAETKDCSVCEGTGNSPYENGKKCTNCSWTGKVLVKHSHIV